LSSPPSLAPPLSPPLFLSLSLSLSLSPSLSIPPYRTVIERRMRPNQKKFTSITNHRAVLHPPSFHPPSHPSLPPPLPFIPPCLISLCLPLSLLSLSLS